MSLKQEIQTHLTDGTFVQWLPQGASDLASEIRQHLPQADDAQAEQFARQVIRLQGVEHFLDAHHDIRLDERTKNLLERATKQLNPQRTYRIACLGDSGAGKSLLINALLGRDLLLSREGKAATGAIIEIRFDRQDNKEVAEVIPYETQAIRQMIKEFIKSYKLKNRDVPDQLSPAFSHELSRWELDPELQGVIGIKDDFTQVRNALVKLVQQFPQGQQLKAEYSLANESEIEQLKALIDDDSPNRQADLISEVVYHLKPSTNQSNAQRALELPNNVCLVDLPGVGGPKMHELLIARGIKEADVLVFIVAPPRVRFLNNPTLIRGVKKHFSSEGGTDTAERTFFVLNRYDRVRDSALWDQTLQEVMQLAASDYAMRPNLALRGGNQAYFKVSAAIAYVAQHALRTGHPDYNQINFSIAEYEKFASDQGILIGYYASHQDYHSEALKASHIPLLADELMKFVSERRISQQIEEGKSLVNELVRSLIEKYKADLYRELDARKISYERKPGVSDELLNSLKDKDIHLAQELLRESQDNLVELVNGFRGQYFPNLDRLLNQYQNEMSAIGRDLGKALSSKMPEFWNNSLASGYAPSWGGKVTMQMVEILTSEVEVFIWDELTQRLVRLVTPLVNECKRVLRGSGLRNQIRQSGFGQPEAEETLAHLDNLIATMESRLRQFTERIALAYALAPSARLSGKYVLSPSPEEKTIGDQNQQRVAAAIPKPPNLEKYDPQPEHFKQFIGTVLDIYQRPIRGKSVRSLLHIYYYELICIENELKKSLEQLFTTLNNRLVTDVSLRKQVLANDVGWDKVHTLIEALRDLGQLYHDS